MCSKLCHELFIDLKNPDAKAIFDEQCKMVMGQIDAFLTLTEEIDQELSNPNYRKSAPVPNAGFKRQESLSNMYEDEGS